MLVISPQLVVLQLVVQFSLQVTGEMTDAPLNVCVEQVVNTSSSRVYEFSFKSSFETAVVEVL